MTEDELDLLASAYLDGEATSEEVDMVERDPQLLARVDALRTVSEQLSEPLSAPPALKEQHLAAALAAFSTGSGAEESDRVDETVDGAVGRTEVGAAAAGSSDPNVIDLTSRSRTGDGTGGSARSRKRRDVKPQAPSRTMPTWLPAAAALLLLAGGGAWVISQASGGGFDSETATDAASGDDAEDSVDATQARASDGEADADTAEESVALGSADEAMEDDAMEDEEAAEEAMEEDDSAADSDFADPAASAPAEEAGDGGGFFPEEPVLSFAEIPTVTDLPEVLPELRTDGARSRCGGTITIADDQTFSGYLPIEIAGEFAELFVITEADGEQSVIVIGGEDCQPKP